MNPQYRSLDELIKQVRARLKARSALRGIAIVLTVAAVSLIAASMLAGLLSQKPGWLIALRILPIFILFAAAWFFLIKPLRARLSDLQIARLIEERCRLADRLVTAVEFSDDARSASPAIVGRLVKDVSGRCASVNLERIVDPRHAYAYGTVSGLVLLAFTGIFLVGPASLSGGMAALYSTGGDSVSASSMFISVSPGSGRAPRGSDQKIKASLNGFDSETAQVFIRKLNADSWVAARMEPARSHGEFQYLIFNIQDSVSYYVESEAVRSPEFTLEVADLPFVKQLDLVLNYPSYTRLASKKIENGGEVATIKGTAVSVVAHLSAQARSARIVLSDGSKIEMVAEGGHRFTGQFTVKENGSYRIEITSDEGERYNGSNEYDIIVLEDHPPTVVIDKPGRDMKVTSIQEVFAQVRAEDDYGVAAIEFFYSVNGGEEKRIQLQDLKSESARSLSGAHTFFLEEYGLQPGDFISYYAKARDNNAVNGGQEGSSDIYFLEVRPFDRQFRQAQQQGGGGGGEQDSNALTRRQREIIAATFRVLREQAGYSPEEKEENFDAVTLSQDKLKTDTEALAERIRRRLGDQLNSEPEFAKLVEYLAQASKEMITATGELRARKAKEALPPEQRALQQLLRAEAIFREIQVARGNQGEGGGNQSEQELADLFELQLDKMKNQYETIQRQQQSTQNQQQDEIARRLQELARRQQQQIEQRMRSEARQQGGGGGGSARQQQEMIDEARRMARELERLSRDRRDPKLAETARQLQQAADEMQRAQASSSSNGQQSTAQAQRALERLEQARRSLESSKQAGGQQDVQRLRQQAEEAIKRQDEIARNVEELARQSQSGQGEQAREQGEEKRQRLAERKQALADQIANLEKDIDQTARGLGQEKQQSVDKLRDAAGAIRRNRIPDRIRQNNQLIENGWYDQARERERTIRGNIEEVLKNLQAAERGNRNQGDSLEESLNRARELADNLESLRRRAEAGRDQQQGQQGQGQANQGQQQGQSNQQGERQSGQQNQASGNQSQRGGGQQSPGGQNRSGQQVRRQQSQSGEQARGQESQSGQQTGQESGGQQSGGQQADRRGGRSVQDPQEMASGGGPPMGGARQLESELRQRVGEAEELRRQLGRNRDLAGDVSRVIEQLRRINPNLFNDPAQLALLKNEVIDPLRQLELELAKKLQAKLGNNGAGAFSDGDAPDRYRKVIEDYYRRLSVRSKEAQP